MRFVLSIIFSILLLSLSAQTEPRLVLPIGHTDNVNTAFFSPDGKLVVTASKDRTVVIWDVATGKEINSLKGHANYVTSAKFTPDNKYVITSDYDGVIRLFELISGKLIRTYTKYEEYIEGLELTQDGKMFITHGTNRVFEVGSGKMLGKIDCVQPIDISMKNEVVCLTKDTDSVKIKLFNLNSWEDSRILHSMDNEISIEQVVFSPNGEYVLMAYDSSAMILSTKKGKQTKIFKGITERIKSAEFSPDGKFVLLVSDNLPGRIFVYDAINAKQLYVLNEHKWYVKQALFSPDGKFILTASSSSLRAFKIDSGDLVYEITDHTESIGSIVFSPDGELFLTTTEFDPTIRSNDATARIYNLKDGRALHILQGETVKVNSIKYSEDSNYELIASNDSVALLWNGIKGVKTQEYLGHIGPINDAVFSSDMDYVFTAGEDGTARMHELTNGKLVSKINGNDCRLSSITTNSVRAIVATADHCGDYQLFDLDENQSIKDSKPEENYWDSRVNKVLFSPDGELLLAYYKSGMPWDYSEEVILYDVETLSEIKRVNEAFGVDQAVFSPDSKKFLIVGEEVKLYNCDQDTIGRTLKGHIDGARSGVFSPDGNLIVTCDPYKVMIFDASSGDRIKTIYGDGIDVSSVVYSPDGRFIGILSWDKTVRVYSFHENRLFSLSGHDDWVIDGEFNADGSILRTIGKDHKTIYWDVKREKQLYTRIHLKGGEYILYDEHYRFDGTPEAIDKLYLVCGLEVIDLAQMKDALYVPGLAEKIMKGEDINYPKLSELEICGTLPLIEKNTEKNDDGYHYIITPRALGIYNVEVKVNGKTVKTYKAEQLTKKGSIYYLDISKKELESYFVSNEENKISVVGTVKENGLEIKSRGITITSLKEDSNVEPNLYAIMVGVNDYKDDRLDLRFPVKDATSLSTVLEQSAKKLLGDEHVFMYNIHSDVTAENGFTTPEKMGIKKAFEEVGKLARAEDVVLVFFAGHGVMQGEDNRFTFLTAEASKENPVGISTAELESWLNPEGPHQLKANKSILIFDACNSGQASKELLAMARDDDATERIRQVEDLKDKSGLFILAASAPNQSAYELPQYQQGLLTYCLLNTLKNNPAVVDDNLYLNVHQWFLESEEELSRIMNDLGLQQDAQPFGTANIRIGQVDEEVKANIKLAAEKPVVFCSSASNSDMGWDDLFLKDQVNQKLSSIQKRGNASNVVYMPNGNANSNQINLTYSLKKEEINCLIVLVKNKQVIHKETLTANKKAIDNLVQQVIEVVEKHAQ